ncbi:hypothetical protein HH308_01995 [Gordonia sp. TBRC 11910]|uniref:Uncharacterized protein n=1 Tax=Gordonia asplenii TaxID=2725283 RepID=A0A848KSX8_9ACTN|nr:hypothetical protein [Gordonia asplenii]NMN99984.1 hypothetical protein [Gordonia asplenii]
MNRERLIRIAGQLGVDAEEAGRAADADEPVIARALVLRRIWNEIDALSASTGLLQAVPAGRRLVEAGADVDDLQALTAHAAYEMAFSVLFGLSEGMAADMPIDAADLPGVALMEIDSDGDLTDRNLVGIHESLLSADPSGMQGHRFLR